MKYYLIEEILGLMPTIEGISDGEVLLKINDPLILEAIALYVRPEKARPLVRILFSNNKEIMKGAYEEYIKYPYSKGRPCWLHKTLAKTVSQVLMGKKGALAKFSEELRKRWPRVCGEVDVLPEVLKLVTDMNEKGYSATSKLEGDEVILNTSFGQLRLRRREAEDLMLVRELRNILKRNKEKFERALELLSSNLESCFDLAEVVNFMEDIPEYGFVRLKLRKKAKELAYKVSLRARRL